MGDHSAEKATQTRYPWRATARTALAFVTGAALSAPVLYMAVTNESAETATGAGLLALSISAAITRVMAVPFVNEWLTRAGLGAEPKSAPVDKYTGGTPVATTPSGLVIQEVVKNGVRAVYVKDGGTVVSSHIDTYHPRA